MSKENEIELMSFTEDGQRWLQCKSCYEYKKVEENTKSITCARCTMINTLKRKPMTEFFAKQRVSTGRPAGWHFMNEYVDKDGNVFHKGKEQPDLKNSSIGFNFKAFIIVHLEQVIALVCSSTF